MGRPRAGRRHRRGLPRGARLTGDPLVARLRAAGSVWAEDEAAVLRGTGRTGAALETLVARRVAGEPLETVVGQVRFAGRDLVVAPGVFVPRRRTAHLARLAAAYAGPGRVLVEMCCGVAPVAALVTEGEVHAADVDAAALECARANAPHARLHLGDLYAALPDGLRGRVDVLVANAPYVPTARIRTMPPEARDHEPLVALDGGADGVDVHRRLAEGAGEWLRPGGVLLVETSRVQQDLTSGLVRDAGLRADVSTDERTGGCVVRGVRPAERA